MLYTGIDLHKRTVVIATVDETGKVVRPLVQPRSRGMNRTNSGGHVTLFLS